MRHAESECETRPTTGPRLGTAVTFYFLVTALLWMVSLGGRDSADLIGVPGDRREFLWNAWWIARAVSSFENPWFTDIVFAPDGTPLVWHSLVPLQSSLIATLTPWVGPGAAWDLVVLLALPLAGSGAWVLCRHMTRDGWASLVGGLVFMFSPFVASKTMGHLNLLYCGFLPVFLACLLRATESDDSARNARAGWHLAAASLALLLSSLAMVVFAANLVAFVAIWRRVRGDSLRTIARRFARALAPAGLLTAPILLVFGWFTIAYGVFPTQRSSYAYNPEPIAYLLPLSQTSAHRPLFAHLASPELAGIEPAAYLGWAVAPLCAAGLWLARRDPGAQLAAMLIGVSVVLSPGPKLLWDREVIEMAGLPVYLPFGLWRWIPILGAVGQPARYLVIGYMAMGVGLAFGLAKIRSRVGPVRAAVAGCIAGGLVVADYAIALPTSPLPPMPPLAGRSGAVADLRLDSLSLYYQTAHGRPLVGGVLSRVPDQAIERYDRAPTLAWLRDATRPRPQDAELLADLETFGVGDVCVAPGTPQDTGLRDAGLIPIYRDGHTAIWSMPETGPHTSP